MDWRDRTKFYAFEKWRESLNLKSRYGVSMFECDKAIIDTCTFFGMPAPMYVESRSGEADWFTCFIDRNPHSYIDDILVYNLEELNRLGVTTKDAFSLIMTHECTHRLLQNTRVPGWNNGRWENELCCDFFMGVRSRLDLNISQAAFDQVCGGLSKTPGAMSHPVGSLREEIMRYGRGIAGFDLVQSRKRSIGEYYNKFLEWLGKNHQRIQLIQKRFY